MRAQLCPLPPVLLACLLAGCASTPTGEFPSLALRDAERVTGTLPPPAAPEAPPPPSSETLDRLDTLRADARQAHSRFLEAAPAARGTVGQAANVAAGSENWARAQVALAGLEAIRSQAMISLADLDHIYVDAVTEGQALERVASARDEVADMVEEEDRLIQTLLETLR